MGERAYKNKEAYDHAMRHDFCLPLVNIEDARKAASTLHMYSVVTNDGRFLISEYHFFSDYDVQDEAEYWGWRNSRGAEYCEMPIRVTGFDVPGRWLSSQQDPEGIPLDWKGDKVENSLTIVEPDTTGVQQARSECGAG